MTQIKKNFNGRPVSFPGSGYDNLHAQSDKGVQEVRTLPVAEVLHTPKNEIVLDFGQVIAGRVRMEVNIPENESVILEHAEVLDRDGNFFNNISGQKGVGDGVDQKDVFVSDGCPTVYEPLFTYHGFRYVKVTGLEDIEPDRFKAIVLSSEYDNQSRFVTSDGRLNKLYENTLWSQRSNMFSVPTDCPQREKAGWTGDINIYSRTVLLNADVTEFLSRWLENLTEEQDESGKVPIVVPYDGPYPALGNMLNQMFQDSGKLTSAGWSDAAVMVPYHIYQVTGNRIILEQQYKTMKNWCDYIIRTVKEKENPSLHVAPEYEPYLWDTGFHWGEWLIPSMEKNPDGRNITIQLATRYISPIFGWNSINCMAQIAEILEQEADAAYYLDISEKMKEAIVNGLIRPEKKMPVEFMGAYVLAIYFELVPEDCRDEFKEHLIQMLEENGGCLDTGFLGTPYILDAFCKIGRVDLAYHLLWQSKCPSWLYEVDYGATGIWENWRSYEDGQPKYTSMNHYSFGCVDDWIFRYIGGIRADRPGFKHMVIEPRSDCPLAESELELETVQGRVQCSWKKENDGEMRIEICIPCNTSATIKLPDNTVHEVGSGHHSYHIL